MTINNIKSVIMINNMKAAIIISVLLLFCASSARAYRPFGVEDAWVAGKNAFQLETSWDYLKWGDGKMENAFLFVPIYGATENLELSAEIPYLFHYLTGGTQNSGTGDVNLVAKFLILEENDNRPAVTVKGIVKTDSGDYGKGLGSGDRDISLLAVASKALKNLIVSSQLGYTWVGKAKNANLRNSILYGLSLDYAVTDPLRIAIEINGNRHPDITVGDDPRSLLFGFIFKQSQNVILDAALRWGLSKASPDFSSIVGASITF